MNPKPKTKPFMTHRMATKKGGKAMPADAADGAEGENPKLPDMSMSDDDDGGSALSSRFLSKLAKKK